MGYYISDGNTRLDTKGWFLNLSDVSSEFTTSMKITSLLIKIKTRDIKTRTDRDILTSVIALASALCSSRILTMLM